MAEINWKELAKPFTADELEWRLGSTNRDKTKGLALPYIQNRAIMNRLDEVVGPPNWKNEYTKAPDGGVLCGISIRVGDEWITKWDGAANTEIEGVKGGLSDAMKRAGVQWGIGRYLYDAENVWMPIKNVGSEQKPVYIIDGTPQLKVASPQRQQPERKAESKATPAAKSQPEQPPSEHTSGGKIERPMSPAQVYEALQRKAIKYDKPADKVVISAGQARTLAIRMGEWMNDDVRKYLLSQAFTVDTSKDLITGELKAIMDWLPPAETASQEVAEYIKQEIRAIGDEAAGTPAQTADEEFAQI